MSRETSRVTRLLTQHRERPHCPSCGRDAPTFAQSSLSLSESDLAGWALRALTFHLRCPCGAEWNLKKTAKE
jgi:hypothetical protein